MSRCITLSHSTYAIAYTTDTDKNTRDVSESAGSLGVSLEPHITAMVR